MYLDDVAVDFPDMPIIMAHPSFPWQELALAALLSNYGTEPPNGTNTATETIWIRREIIRLEKG
jgi:predicted TIM-barrel fold metal-dependent hydrolase